MLKQLHIHNIILIQSAEIHFGEGFNVISGETGSGKSALLGALGLILGDKTDTDILREGCDKGRVEAVFEVEGLDTLLSHLSETGIEQHKGEDLIIRREITSQGKTRSFINNQPVQVSFLRKIAPYLIRQASQHAHHQLFSSDHHRELLDIYGNLHELVSAFSKNWELENALRSEIHTFEKNEIERTRKIEHLREDLEELQGADLKEGEEEELFSEYTLLSNSDELRSCLQNILQNLEGEKAGALTYLNRCAMLLEKLTKMDSAMTPTAESFQAVFLELKELTYGIQNYYHKVDSNPARLEQVNARLSLINKLKRRYGSTIPEVLVQYEQMKTQLHALENADERIHELKQQLQIVLDENNASCQEISHRRHTLALEFSKLITQQLHSLNMPKAEFEIKVTTQKRTRYGDDAVEFFIAPNLGERLLSVKDGASGGELSRLLLSIQTLLAGKEQVPTLIFDEIDSNIGGATAAEVGKKLKTIGAKHQIICITHFPQVAKQANHHYQIFKQEKQGRTLTQIACLDEQSKNKELSRMRGEPVGSL